MKYPIGTQDFASIINDGYVYVDKTALIYRWWRKEAFRIGVSFSSVTGSVSDWKVNESN